MKIKINGKLPEGFKYVNGTIVKTMKAGGAINNTLGPMNRDEANLEAEKGETALTDLTNDGSFELYNIGGNRHSNGGTPLNLPEQSFIYSDTRKMNLTLDELKLLGITSKKKMTPAKASKNFPLNKYIEIIEDETSDKISIATAEDMINKNKIKLSQLAFIQESKKNFSDGLPLAAYPFLIESGVNPQELEAKIQEQNNQQGPTHTMPDGTVHPGATHEEYMAMQNQGGLQEFTGPPQGGMPPMGKYGTELPQAMFGMAGLKYANPFMKNKDEKLKEDVGNMMSMGKMFAGAQHGIELPSYQTKGEIEHEKRKEQPNPSLEQIIPELVDESQIPGSPSWRDNVLNNPPRPTALFRPGAQYGAETSPMTGQPMVPKMGVPEGYVRDQNPLGLPGYQIKGEIMAAESGPGIECPNAREKMKGCVTKGLQFNEAICDCQESAKVNNRNFLGNIGTRIGNIFRSDEKDINPNKVIYDPKSGMTTSIPLNPKSYGESMSLGSGPISPFKADSLKQFTDGGSLAINQAAQQGRLSDSQIALQNILKYRKQLITEYEQTKSFISENPNILEDPEKAYEIQASIQVMEQQLNEIDIQTQSIEAKMIQDSLQIDPFADPSMPPQGAPQNPSVAKYGKELPRFQDTGEFDPSTLQGSEAWGYQGTDEYGMPIIGSSEPAFETYNPDFSSGQSSHADAFDVMASKDFDPPRKLWIQKYREAAAKNKDGKNNWIQGKSDAELFMIFNKMNQFLSTAHSAGHKFDANGAPDDAAAKKYGWGDTAPTEEEVKIFQGMYTSLNNAKLEDESGLLDQIVTTPMGGHHVYTKKDIAAMKKNKTWTDEKVGDNKMVDAEGNPVSFVDGKLGHTTGGQFYRADNKTNTSTTTIDQDIPCPEEVRNEKMKECLEKGQRFDQASCDCAPVTGDWTTPKYPEYETFPQDDLLVATKSAQLAGLEQINPVMEPTLDPVLVNPMYVDPRQELASVEASAAAAMRANPDQASSIMGAVQDASEKIINKHEALNTKIYNNAQNINIPLINEAGEQASNNFKTYMDDSNAAKENYNVAKMELTDNLVNAFNDQMTNADELYIRNLENPQFWYSPQAHNIEYYNARDLDGKVSSTNPLDQELANYEYLHAQNPDFAKIYYEKMYGKKNDPGTSSGVDVSRASDKNKDDTARHGLETKRMKKRQTDLLRSKVN